MKAALLLVLAAGASQETVVRPGESLAQVAARTLGSDRAGPELLAFNHLEGAPAPGTHLLLPGPERERAVSAIASARSAIAQAKQGASRTEAEARLAQAQALLARARYAEAAAQADGAWKLLADAGQDPSRFAVAVEPDGRTHVRVRQGSPVRVEAEGKTRSVRAGEQVTVAKGEPPGNPEPELGARAAVEAPVLLFPEAGLKLALDPASGGLGPVRFAWKPVPDATGYVFDLAGQRARSLRTAQPTLTLPALPAGSYRWTVRALLSDGSLGPASSRTVQLVPSRIRLEVKEAPWQ